MSGMGWSSQDQIQQAHERAREQFRRNQQQGWEAQQKERGRQSRDRLGCIAGTIRGLLSLVFGLAWVAAFLVAGLLALSEQYVVAAAAGAGALVLLVLTTKISGWGRS